MKDEYKDIFKKLGYNVDIKGAVLFSAILDDVVDMIEEGKNEMEIRDMFPAICLELYRFYFEITRKKFMSDIDLFRSSITRKNRKRVNELLEMGLDNDGSKLELEDSVLFFGNYIVKMRNNLLKNDNQKVFKKVDTHDIFKNVDIKKNN